MNDNRLAPLEAKFADLIWKTEPVASGELAKLALQELSWKRTTSYTILKRLVENGMFVNEGGTVRSLISRDAYYAMQSERMVEENFSGSLPAFIAAFSKTKKLTRQEVDQLQALIDSFEEE